MLSLLVPAWRYRSFIGSSIANDLKLRVARSKLGWLWIVLQPFAQALVYAVVLSNVLAAKIPGIDNKYSFAIYLLAGMLCWSIFSEIIQRSLTVFIDNSSLLKKMQFPRICLPVIVVGSALVNNLVLLGIVMLIVPVLGIVPTVHLLWIPGLLAVTIALASGIGLLLGTLNVFSRDVGQIMAVVLQFWFWFTPIVYPASIVPTGFDTILAANPVTALVAGYQSVVLYGKAPDLQSLAYPIITSLVFLAIALVVFRRASPEMVDSL